jgi:Na+/H+-dicarboxylate symporter
VSDYSAPSSSPTPPPAGYNAAPAATPGKTLGIVGLILAFFIPLVGLILGIVGLNQSKKAGRKNGIALAAIIVSSVFIVIGIIVAIVVGVGAASAGQLVGDAIQQCQQLGESGVITINGTEVQCSSVLGSN